MYKKKYIIYSCCKTSVLKVVFDEEEGKKESGAFSFSVCACIIDLFNAPIRRSSYVFFNVLFFVSTLPVG